MPTFSPDGSLLVFNDHRQGAGHSLTLMDYSTGTRKASNAREVYTHESAYLGWPFVLPDNRAIIFARSDYAHFDGNGVGITLGGGTPLDTRGPSSDLAMVDVTTGQAFTLAQAMGFRTASDESSSDTYLPFGDEDLHQVYYPVVSPVASGGYFWVFFDSVRHYGNVGKIRQLWGTALTIASDGTYAEDPSHPAFYISGQDVTTANHRAFTALDPCHMDGTSCESGIDCCSGRCHFLPEDEFQTSGSCEPVTNECSNEDERCEVATDCCLPEDGSPPYQCISGFCAVVGGVL
jgi:hypothetical protein